MRIRAGLTRFSITARDGRCRQFSWLWVLPIAAVPALVVVTLLFFGSPLVSDTVRLARWVPEARRDAARLFLHANRRSIENLLASEPARATSELPTLNLTVPKNTLLEMQRALVEGDPELGHAPGSDMPYFDATLVDEDGDLIDGKLCLRGLSAWHHHPGKPSLRFKIPKDEVRDGRRYIELSRPEDVLALKNWIPDQLGRRLGLISDFSDHVRLFVNAKYFGVYLRTMRPGEALALANGRMPGTFFKGEFRGDWDTWDEQQAFADLWGPDPVGWRTYGEESAENQATFERFLSVLRNDPPLPTVERLARIERLLDLEAYARWSALMIVTGSSHTDWFHNQVFFLASTHGLLEAVPWDANAYGMHSDAGTPPDLVLHPVMDLVLRDPRWRHRRDQLVHELLATHAEAASLHRLIDATVDRMLPDLKADVNLSSLELLPDLVPWSVLDIEPKRREIQAWVTARCELLASALADARVSVEPDSGRPGWSRVEVSGAVAVRVARADGEAPQADTWAGSPDVLYPGLTEELFDYFSTPLWKQTCKVYARPVPLTYRVRGLPDELRFENAITGAPVQAAAGPLAAERAGPQPRSVHPSLFAAPHAADVVLGPGEVLLSESLRVGPQSRLVIQPGTRIRLEPGVGIYSRGPTLVLGRADAPVELAPAGPSPWASFGVSGADASGSRFEHMIVSGGSIGADEGVHFKGMFSVHEASRVTLRACRFGPNLVGDDAVNLVQSEVEVQDCRWDGALSDGLDLDMCRGTVRRCVWRGSGNDGIDLMACDVEILECEFVGSGDKGISVGEGSQAAVRDCRIVDCDIGIEVKDRSRALVVDTLLEGNRVGLHSYQKKWLYGSAGTTALVSCVLRGSRELDLSIERRGRLLLLDTTPGPRVEGGERIEVVGELGDEWEPLRSRALQ